MYVGCQSYVGFADTEAVDLADDWSIEALCCVPCIYETWVAQLEIGSFIVEWDLCVIAIEQAEAVYETVSPNAKAIAMLASPGAQAVPSTC